jgi:hypothetical protein
MLAVGGTKAGAAFDGMLVSAKVAARPPAQRPEISFFIFMISLKGDFPCNENGPCRLWFRRLLTNNLAAML